MKIFAYFVEPASYTLDLIENIHNKLEIEHAFINDKSMAISNKSFEESRVLSGRSIFSRIIFLYKVWRDYDFIIINGYNNYPFIITFIINLFSIKKRFIAIESDTQLKFPKNILKRFIKNVYLNIVFRNAYVLGFSGGSTTHKELFRNYGMKEERIFMIPMMIDNKKYYQDDKIFPEIFTFLFVGRILDTKNVDVLCDKFLSSFSDKKAQLIIVGEGEKIHTYKNQYSHDKIQFKGSLFEEELVKIYHNASVFVFPSSVEEWGLVLNEAMSASLPVIAHREVGATHDLILGKDTGFIFKDWDELEAIMMKLYHNPNLCKKYSKNSISLMKTYWNYNLYERNLLGSIREVKQWR